MSALDTLIKVKKQAKTDDLILFLDEMVVYEKLAKVAAFRDLKTSKAAQKKLPMLSGAYNGNLYSLSMVQMVGNIMAHLEDRVPDILVKPLEGLTPKEEKRLSLLAESLIKVRYDALAYYDHETMGDHVVAVFTEEKEKETAILIVVRDGIEYRIFQGYYSSMEKPKQEGEKLMPYTVTKNGGTIQISTYSVQGNNAYPFATVETPEGVFSVMLPSYDTIWLFPENGDEKKVIPMSMAQRNEINMAKTEVGAFAECLLNIIQGRLEDETAASSSSGGIGTDQK